jgi:hypothetical protein
MKTWLLILALTFTACASAPPSLSPAGQQAFQNTRVIKGLDLLRDTAIAANAEVPPLLNTATTRKVVQYHESSLKVMQASGSGWKPAVLAGLDELPKDLPPAEVKVLAPYLGLVKTLLEELP